MVLIMQKHVSFYYATGATFCINSVLMPQLEKYVRLDLLIYMCQIHTYM